MIDAKDLPDMLGELRKIVQSVDGVSSIDETMTISYIAEVDDEAARARVEQVGVLLSAQAERFGLVIELTPATSEEIKEAQQKYAEFVASQSKFKA